MMCMICEVVIHNLLPCTYDQILTLSTSGKNSFLVIKWLLIYYKKSFFFPLFFSSCNAMDQSKELGKLVIVSLPPLPQEREHSGLNLLCPRLIAKLFETRGMLLLIKAKHP